MPETWANSSANPVALLPLLVNYGWLISRCNPVSPCGIAAKNTGYKAQKAGILMNKF